MMPHMRAMPWVLGFLVVVAGGYLGFQVLLQQPPTVAPPSTGGPASGSTVPQGHVYTGLCEQPESINPFTTNGAVARRYVLGLTHETLFDTDPDTLALRPVLAESYRADEDGRGFKVVLRQGVRFADGQPCTPADVLFTWQVCKGLPPSLLGSMADGMSLLQDAQLLPGEPPTLHLELKQPHFAALRAIGESWIVVERAYFERRVAEVAKDKGQAAPRGFDDPAFAAILASIKEESGPGTGPYMLAPDAAGSSQWHPGPDLRLVRNPSSWRKAAHPDRWNFAGVHLICFRDTTKPFLLLLSRELDWYYQAGDLDKVLDDNPELRSHYRKVVYTNPLYGPMLVHWNLRQEKLADPRVRRALGMLFDRDTIVHSYFHDTAAAAAGLFPPGSAACPADLQPLPFDPTAARQLLRQAGFDPEQGNALQLRLIVPAGMPGGEQIVSSFASAAAKAGVSVDARPLDFGAIAQLQKDGDWDGYLIRRDPRTWIDPYELFHSEGGGNIMGFADSDSDRLLQQARTELDDGLRNQLFQQWCRRIAELQPVTFLVFPRNALLMNSHLENAAPGLLGVAVEKMWVAPEFQRR